MKERGRERADRGREVKRGTAEKNIFCQFSSFSAKREIRVCKCGWVCACGGACEGACEGSCEGACEGACEGVCEGVCQREDNVSST